MPPLSSHTSSAYTPSYGYVPGKTEQFLSSGEIATLFDATIGHLKDTVYYCVVDNIRKRNRALSDSKKTLTKLAYSIDTSDANPVALNLQNLLLFIAYSLDTVLTTNMPAAAHEALALLEPIRTALLHVS